MKLCWLTTFFAYLSAALLCGNAATVQRFGAQAVPPLRPAPSAPAGHLPTLLPESDSAYDSELLVEGVVCGLLLLLLLLGLVLCVVVML